MRKTSCLWLTGIMILLAAAHLGCNGDDDPAEPDPCSLAVTSPQPGASFMTEPQETVNIRWTKTGTATAVRIELLQGGVSVGEIAATADNDGYHPWTAAVMGGIGGDDFSIRITALGQTDCTATSGVFTIVNTAACSFDFTTEILPETTLRGGDPLAITWDGSNTTGQVGIELRHGHLNEVLVGVISLATADDGLYSWTVDSFNDSAHRTVSDPSVYWLKILDADVTTCWTASPDFTLTDDTVYSFNVFLAPSGPNLAAGQVVTVNFLPVGNAGTATVRIALYAGSIVVPGGTIATDLAVADQAYQWTVDDHDFVGGGSNFNVRVFATQDGYIWGQSANFSIVP